MKKALFGLVLFALPLFASAASFDANLSYGSTGLDVTALQEFLTAQQVYSGPISGNFFSLTLAAVKKFQKAEGISPVSGFVGPITRSTINTLLVAPDSEENATTSTPIDLSTTTVTVAPTSLPPQIIYVQVPTPVQPQVQSAISSVSPPVSVPTTVELFPTNPRIGTDMGRTIPQGMPQTVDVAGGNCALVTLYPVIFDQNGTPLKNIPIAITNPETGIVSNLETGPDISMWYMPQTTNTVETVTYTSGNLTGTFTVHVGLSQFEMGLEKYSATTPGNALGNTTGNSVNTITGKCN